MKRMALAVLLLCTATKALASTPEESGSRAPYFVVEGGDPSIDALPLKSTDVDVVVVGVMAEVRVRQIYANEGSRPINTTYVFPGSTRAAVHGLTMRVGERQVRAKIREREQAQQEFAQAKAKGQTASLLTQERPNVFTMRLANILPKDRVEVQLQYSELLIPDGGHYEFVFPTVVGPRYVSRTEPAEAWPATPITRPANGPASTGTLAIRARINGGAAIFDVASPSHTITVQRERSTICTVALAGPNEGTRDFILRYRLADDDVTSGSLFSPIGEDGEGHFMVMVQPPRVVRPAHIPGREFVFVVDVSGSMGGFPLETAKELLERLVGELRPTDTFNILFFSGGSQVLAPASLPVTKENVGQGLTMLSKIEASGGTELLPALSQAFSLPRYGSLARSIVVITDGYVTVEREALELVAARRSDASVFAFGIGSSVNRSLIEGLAAAGKGEPFVVTDARYAHEAARRFVQYVHEPVLTNVTVRFKGLEVFDLEPSSVPDVLGTRPVVVLGKWRGSLRGTVTVSGVTGRGPWSQTLPIEEKSADPRNEALRLAWARERVARISDFAAFAERPGESEEVTQLGLRYGLLTKYTSFVAILEEARTFPGPSVEVQQPLLLPDGVGEAAVGGIQRGDEPPFATVAFLGVMVLVGALFRRFGWRS